LLSVYCDGTPRGGTIANAIATVARGGAIEFVKHLRGPGSEDAPTAATEIVCGGLVRRQKRSSESSTWTLIPDSEIAARQFVGL
jgi:hypothetical protein